MRRFPSLISLGLGVVCLCAAGCGDERHASVQAKKVESPATLRQVKNAFLAERVALIPNPLTFYELTDYVALDYQGKPIFASVDVFRSVLTAHGEARLVCGERRCLSASNVIVTIWPGSTSKDRRRVQRALARIGRVVPVPP